jgi:two-component system, LuxR family, sensor kinase FixL
VEVVKRIKGLLHRGEADLKPTDVVQLLKDTLSIARSELRERRIVTRLHVPLSLPQVLADRVQIQQVVLNLLLNAADAMTNTPQQNRAIEIAAMHNPPVVTVSIADRGSGVDDSRLHEIFEPFYSSKSEGVGLGLAISRSIIAAHGGRLWVVNNPGGGATMHFTLQEFR